MSVAYSQQQQQPQPQQQQPHPSSPMSQSGQQHRGGMPSRGPGGVPPPSAAHIQKILDENCGLIQTIQDYQNVGKVNECMSYHQALHRNLVYLAQIADSSQNIAQILPPPHVLQASIGQQMPPMHGAAPPAAPTSQQMPPQQHHPSGPDPQQQQPQPQQQAQPPSMNQQQAPPANHPSKFCLLNYSEM